MEFPQAAKAPARSEFRGYGVRGITAAAVLLAAGALNLASGQPAEARSGGAWDRLAGCESGGNWRIDTGNGFSGGLQLAHSTWHSFGGGAYATRAARATRSQQIQVAQRVLARQGWGAWPACSASLGLNSADAHRTARSTPVRPAPQQQADPSARARARHPQHRHSQPRHSQPRPAESHEKRYKVGRHRSTGGSVVVNSGDTLSGIAYAHGLGWREFYRLNRQVIGANPHLIFPGTRLAVPHSGAH
ncbi:LysM domain-containing protein [Streptomyces sp. 2224.1]|uniref:LysM peptidoglycan-binding domain-containing protein n=1 Tax=unclassified Streptomyces TaxID=2593676 RepID=UPI0008814138|nr:MULTISPECIES: transglycosylase family protein [unclassified Streptomyces]PBC86827.1 LysM domain-containing protein [Streptomyces sp. 2321.6]SDQ71043.1 LysM domain-containing protein [Streptomyces sp. KS_16]SED42401.1 LysM domain-containing protein [Streptomyces sp. 2112.3]SED80662.1 LysM domain-containing protein [Streptomyces sp. 2224.1]SEE10696.1 LysM domain-containing protein [Streptomyces sp. 2133.1]